MNTNSHSAQSIGANRKAASWRLSFFIARRYLRSKHSLNFITVITGISIGGITLGVASLIIVMSLFNGFQSLIDRFLVGFDPHIRITAVQISQEGNSAKASQWLTTNDSLESKIQSALQPLGAINLAPLISGKMVCINGRSMKPFQLIGMDAAKAGLVSGIAKTVAVGEFRLDEITTPNGQRCLALVMGATLADNLRLVIGDTVQILAPQAIENAITQAVPPKMQRAVIVGIFQSNTKEYDATQAYTSLTAAQRLLRLPANAAQSLDIRLQNVHQSNQAQSLLASALGANYRIETWFDLHRELYSVMRFERLAAFCVLLIIVLVAVFNIFASLSMTVTEKRSEIGMLKAMGASGRLITRIFFGHSFIVGILGTALGAALGIGLCWGQMNFGWIELDTSRYVIPILPLIVQWQDVVLVCGIALALSLFAGLAPARQAGQVRSAIALLRKERL